MDTLALASSLRSFVATLHKTLRKQMYSTHSYSVTEMETIGHLYRNDSLLPTELAALTRVKTQSMSQILRSLEQQGIITRKPSQADKRKVYISLSAAGRKLVEKSRYDRDELLRNIIEARLTDKDQAVMEKALPVLNKLIEP